MANKPAKNDSTKGKKGMKPAKGGFVPFGKGKGGKKGK